jgi:Tfp pilus assembly protein PilF
MKSKILSLTLLAGSLFSTSAFSQKSVETSAALEFIKYGEALMKGEVDLAKKNLTKAKGYIDVASAHEETKDSPKTLYYKGEIYSSYLSLGLLTNDTVFIKSAGENALEISIEAFKKGYSISNKFDSEIKDAVYNKKFELEKYAGILYSGNMFNEALDIYSIQVDLSDAISMVDSLSIFNSGICAEKAGKNAIAAESYLKCCEIGYKAPLIYALAANALRKDGKKAEAKEILLVGRSKYPNDKDILLEVVNTDLEAGDNAAAEKSLADAIAEDPNNKQLYLTIGTIYIELKQDEKAEIALNKAIEIDPNYTDAQYQLGALLSGSAISMKQEASQLKQGDPNYEKMLAKADELYRKAVVPLEAYIAKNPNDKQVLIILAQIYRSLKNPEKSAEYKKRADAL